MEGLQKVREGNVLKRRGLLAGVTALGAALVAKLGTADRVEAADGGNMIIGATNNATSTTSLVNANTTTALYVQSSGGRTLYTLNTGTGTTLLAQGAGGAASGVQGESGTNAGLIGTSSSNAGVYGQGAYGCWGQGLGSTGVGIYGAVTAGSSAVAGLFDGPVVINGAVTINGNFGATGMKSSIVKNRRGVDVRLFAVEAPDSVFEDFGMATTGADGVALVNIPVDFRDVVNTEQYLVFLTPYGRNGGLFVEEQNEGGFKVRDGAGTNGVTFSWRIVAKRSDIEIPRLAPISAESQGQRVERIRKPDLVPAPAGGPRSR